ncbi:MAG TPA: hypothetical protein PKE31_20155 [Pseudomonadota bacterium]|nr:hypothetical protein [Pseudomonadota bacterium]
MNYATATFRFWTVCGFVALASATASAQMPADWKAIQGVKGCAGIPYSSLRSSCKDKGEDVGRYCKSDANPFSCDGLGTKGLLAAIDGIKGEIERLKSARDDQKNRRSNAKDDNERRDAEDKIKEIEDKLYKTEGRLESHKKQVDDNKSEAEKRIYNGEKCRDARRAVQELFKDVISRAKGESDPVIKEIASSQISHVWEPEYTDHEDHLSRVVAPAIEKCRGCKSGDR